jgi:hypothetical protein
VDERRALDVERGLVLDDRRDEDDDGVYERDDDRDGLECDGLLCDEPPE